MTTTTKVVQERNSERQIGCMAGFLNIFDRHQIVAGKQIHSTKRLPHSASDPALDLTQPERRIAVSSSSRGQSEQSLKKHEGSEACFASRLPFVLQILDVSEGCKTPCGSNDREAPRLSLDSRATVDAKGNLKPRVIRIVPAVHSEDNDKQRRSTSLIAKLMGLESLPDSDRTRETEPELRRSASESRIKRDLVQPQVFDRTKFQLKSVSNHKNRPSNASANSLHKEDEINGGAEKSDEVSWHLRGVANRKSNCNSVDFFPATARKQETTIFNDNDRRRRAIDEPARKDLEVINRILESLQLKGVMHSQKPQHQIQNSRRIRHESPPNLKPVLRSNLQNQARAKNLPPIQIDTGTKSPARRRFSSSNEQRKASPSSSSSSSSSPVRSDRIIARKTRSEFFAIDSARTSKERGKKKIAVPLDEGELSGLSAATLPAVNSQIIANKKTTMEDVEKVYHDGAGSSEGESQPSPISVLDSSLYKEQESLSPPSIFKRNVTFKVDSDEEVIGRIEVEREEERWSSIISRSDSKAEEIAEGYDFTYISSILHAFNSSSPSADVFSKLERQQLVGGGDASPAGVSILDRKLIFDTVTEILDVRGQLPPWKAANRTGSSADPTALNDVLLEIRRLRERDSPCDQSQVIYGIIDRDYAGDTWGDVLVEMSDPVLDIERLIFKDLIGETIKALAFIAGKCSHVFVSRRKLSF